MSVLLGILMFVLFYATVLVCVATFFLPRRALPLFAIKNPKLQVVVPVLLFFAFLGCSAGFIYSL